MLRYWRSTSSPVGAARRQTPIAGNSLRIPRGPAPEYAVADFAWQSVSYPGEPHFGIPGEPGARRGCRIRDESRNVVSAPGRDIQKGSAHPRARAGFLIRPEGRRSAWQADRMEGSVQPPALASCSSHGRPRRTRSESCHHVLATIGIKYTAAFLRARLLALLASDVSRFLLTSVSWKSDRPSYGLLSQALRD
jgi:hypothetical protein